MNIQQLLDVNKCLKLQHRTYKATMQASAAKYEASYKKFEKDKNLQMKVNTLI